MRISVNRDKHVTFVAGVVLVKKKINGWMGSSYMSTLYQEHVSVCKECRLDNLI